MKKIKYIVVVVCCLGFVELGYAQGEKTKELLNKVTTSYENKKQYQIAVTYNMHRGFTGNTITESYNGKMIRNDDFTQFKLASSEILRFSQSQLSIDHDEKKIIYSQNNKNGNVQNSPLDINGFLEYYDQTKITEKNDVLICEMVSTKTNFQNPYGKVVMYINKNSYQIEKQELFFSTLIPFAESDNNAKKMDYGRLVILLNHEDLKNKAKPNLGDYIDVSSKNKMSLKEQYQGYTLINQAN
ncbi:hypothetical protein [Aquimarina sp. 2201CG5-10]|uniref:hypothetical protein n=1 Tax=Aquimarina callyspongiae TaxID=3098150 RepID=UPI002AB42195|nr:hypothetical protein [Aquimarina sp. 2201CG5-10]MDY8138496.1 hypothetical protein [Aquimarina sp. 2201CG5-10]